jgi:hypothetical protein
VSERTPRRRTNLAKQRTACLTATTAALRATIHPHGALVATGSASPAHEGPAAAWARDSQQQLRQEGLSAIEASNVVAYLAGLHAVEGGWSIDEIDRLVALRARVECAGVAS